MALDTGHLRVRHINPSMHDTFALRAHAELLNNAFPLFEGRPDGLKAITQLCSGCPSLLNGEISIASDGNLTVDEDSGEIKMKNDQIQLKKKLLKAIRHNSYISEILSHSNNSLKNILASMLLTDGHIYRKGREHNISYKGYNEELHLIFAAIIHKLTGKVPGTFLQKYDENGALIYRTIFRSEDFLNEILKKSIDFRTCPRDLPKNEFLRKYKPSLKFCLSENAHVKRIILQLAMAAEGYVSPAFERNFRISVGFACSHPALVKQWKQLFNELGINMLVKKDCNGWAGVIGLYVSDMEEVKKFKENIGFTPTIEITNTNAPWKGMTKQKLLEKSIEYHNYLNYRFKTEGSPIKKYNKNWKNVLVKYIRRNTAINGEHVSNLHNIISIIKLTDAKISPSKFLKVCKHIERHGYLNNETFRSLTNLKGINSWIRSRRALKAYYGDKITEKRVWRSYSIILGGKNVTKELPKKVLVLGSGAN